MGVFVAPPTNACRSQRTPSGWPKDPMSKVSYPREPRVGGPQEGESVSGSLVAGRPAQPKSASRGLRWPPLRSVAPDLFAFLLGLGAAWILHWQASDLVWTLWLS